MAFLLFFGFQIKNYAKNDTKYIEILAISDE